MILQTPLHILKFIRLILLSYSLSLNLWTETLICTRNWDPALVTNVQWEIRSLNLQNYMSCKNYIGLFQNRILSLNTVNCPYNQYNKIEKEKKQQCQRTRILTLIMEKVVTTWSFVMSALFPSSEFTWHCLFAEDTKFDVRPLSRWNSSKIYLSKIHSRLSHETYHKLTFCVFKNSEVRVPSVRT